MYTLFILKGLIPNNPLTRGLFCGEIVDLNHPSVTHFTRHFVMSAIKSRSILLYGNRIVPFEAVSPASQRLPRKSRRRWINSQMILRRRKMDKIFCLPKCRHLP